MDTMKRCLIFPVSPPILDFIIICLKIKALRDVGEQNGHYFGHYFTNLYGLYMMKNTLLFPKNFELGKGIKQDKKERFYFYVGIPKSIQHLYPTSGGNNNKQVKKFLTGYNSTYQEALRNVAEKKREAEHDLANRIAKHDPIVRKAEILLEKICTAFDENNNQLSRKEWHFNKLSFDFNELENLRARETEEEKNEYDRLINLLRQTYLKIAEYEPTDDAMFKEIDISALEDKRREVTKDGEPVPTGLELDLDFQIEQAKEKHRPFYHNVGMVSYSQEMVRKYKRTNKDMAEWSDEKVLQTLVDSGMIELGFSKFDKERYDDIIQAYKDFEDENYAKTTGKGKINVSFSEACESYLKSNKSNVERIKTVNKYKLLQKKFIDRFGDLDLTDITTRLGEDYVNYLEQEEKLPQSSIRDRLSGVSVVLTYATRQGLMESNPFIGISTKGRGTKSKSRALWRDDKLKALINLDMKPQFKLLFKVLICTGMRLEEASALQWKDIQVNDEQIPLFDLTRVNAVLKTPQSRRRVPIVKVLKIELDKYRETLTNKELEDDKLVFDRCNMTFDSDNKVSTSISKKLIRSYKSLQDEDYDRLTNHGLRKTFRNKCRDVGMNDSEALYVGGWEQKGMDTTYLDQPQSFRNIYEKLNQINFGFILGG